MRYFTDTDSLGGSPVPSNEKKVLLCLPPGHYHRVFRRHILFCWLYSENNGIIARLGRRTRVNITQQWNEGEEGEEQLPGCDGRETIPRKHIIWHHNTVVSNTSFFLCPTSLIVLFLCVCAAAAASLWFMQSCLIEICYPHPKPTTPTPSKPNYPKPKMTTPHPPSHQPIPLLFP